MLDSKKSQQSSKSEVVSKNIPLEKKAKNTKEKT